MTIAVVAAIVRRNDRILIARRASSKEHGGLWELPGGKIEDGETPEEALRREMAEEFGLKVEVGGFVEEIRHDESSRTIRLLCYECYIDGSRTVPVVPRPGEHSEVRWATPGELRGHRFTPADVPVITRLAGGG